MECMSQKRLHDTWKQYQQLFGASHLEQVIRITKDIIFDRLKAYNAIQMFNFVTKTMDMYYKRRLLALAGNRLDHFVALRFTISGMNADKAPLPHTIHATESEDVYTVESRTQKNQTWIVDLRAGTCTCPRGREGQPCAHQLSASLKYRRHCLNKIPTASAVGRRLYAQVAVGKDTLPLQFYSHLHQKEEDNYMETLGVEPEWKQENECLLSGRQSITSDESALKVSFTAQGHDFDTPENPECLSIEKTLSVQNMTSEYDDVTAGLANTMEDIHQKLESGDDEFLKSVKEFCKQYKKIVE